MAHSYRGSFADWEIEIARHVVFKFVSRNPQFESEAEDLLQDCLIHWWQVRATYREGMGASRKTYMTRVLERLLINFRKAQKTDRRRINYEAVSLSHQAPGNKRSEKASPTIEDTTPDATAETKRRHQGLKPELKVAFRQLSARQQRIADLRAQGYSISSIAEALRIHRSTVHKEIKRIRKIFLVHGLRDYLD